MSLVREKLDLSMSTYEVLRKLQCHRLFCTNVLGSGHLTKCSVTYKLLQKIGYSWAAYKCCFFCGGVINMGRIQSVNTKASNVPKSHQWCHLKWRWIRSAHRLSSTFWCGSLSSPSSGSSLSLFCPVWTSQLLFALVDMLYIHIHSLLSLHRWRFFVNLGWNLVCSPRLVTVTSRAPTMDPQHEVISSYAFNVYLNNFTWHWRSKMTMQFWRLGNTGWASKAHGWKIKAQATTTSLSQSQWKRRSEAWRAGWHQVLTGSTPTRNTGLNNPNTTGFDPPWAVNSGKTFQLQIHTWSTKESFWLKTNNSEKCSFHLWSWQVNLNKTQKYSWHEALVPHRKVLFISDVTWF